MPGDCICRSLPESFHRDAERPFLGGHAEELDARGARALLRCTECGQLWSLVPSVDSAARMARKIATIDQFYSQPEADSVAAAGKDTPGIDPPSSLPSLIKPWLLFWRAVNRLWGERRDLLRALLLPSLAIAGVGLLDTAASAERWWLGLCLSALQLLLATCFAVACHRIVILGEQPGWLSSWRSYHTRFLAWSIGIPLIAGAALLPGVILTAFISELGSLTFSIMAILLFVAWTYLTARLSLVLPAAALGHRFALADSWERSRSNGWRLVLLLTVLPVTALLITEAGVSYLFPGGHLVVDFLQAFVLCLAGAVEVCVLSVAYMRLVQPSEWAQPPPNKALQLTPESRAVTTCGIVLAAGAAVPALPVSAFWCS